MSGNIIPADVPGERDRASQPIDQPELDDLAIIYGEAKAHNEILSSLGLEIVPNMKFEAADWRIRVRHQENIQNELLKLGKLIALACGSLMIAYGDSRLRFPVR